MISVRLRALSLIIAASFFSVTADSTATRISQTPYVVIKAGSPGDEAHLIDWSRRLADSAIHDWARSVGIYLDEQRGPVENHYARFVTRYGSRVRFQGLDRNRIYRVFIDFVGFSNPRGVDIQASLEISVGGLVLRSLRFGDLSGESNPCLIEIPYSLTQTGELELFFREHSPTGGYFGVWSIVLTDQPGIPKEIVVSTEKEKPADSMETRSGLVESKPELKKLRTGKKEKAEKPVSEKTPGKKKAGGGIDERQGSRDGTLEAGKNKGAEVKGTTLKGAAKARGRGKGIVAEKKKPEAKRERKKPPARDDEKKAQPKKYDSAQDKSAEKKDLGGGVKKAVPKIEVPREPDSSIKLRQPDDPPAPEIRAHDEKNIIQPKLPQVNDKIKDLPDRKR